MFRLSQAGVKLGDYASLMCELLADNADPLAPLVYEAIDMPFVTLMHQLAEDWRGRSSVRSGGNIKRMATA